jgi:3-phenylpropionate/trans-cinnamate dioxygenase ferredoxin subunit
VKPSIQAWLTNIYGNCPMKDEWMVVTTTDALHPGEMKRIEIDGHRYLIVNAGGQIYAVDDLCSHEEVSLYLGCIEGDMIRCSLHGSRFSLKNGAPMEDPATEPIKTYAVKINADRIYFKPEQN